MNRIVDRKCKPKPQNDRKWERQVVANNTNWRYIDPQAQKAILMSRLFEVASKADNRTLWPWDRRFNELNTTFPSFRKRFDDAGLKNRWFYSCMLSEDFCEGPQHIEIGDEKKWTKGWRNDESLRKRIEEDFPYYEFIHELCKSKVEVRKVERRDLIPRAGSKNFKYAKHLAQFAISHSVFWQTFRHNFVRHLKEMMEGSLEKQWNAELPPEFVYEQTERDDLIIRAEIKWFSERYDDLLKSVKGTIEEVKKLRSNCIKRLDGMTGDTGREYFALSHRNGTRRSKITVPHWAIMFCYKMVMYDSESLFRSCAPLFFTSLMFCVYKSAVPVEVGHLTWTHELIQCE